MKNTFMPVLWGVFVSTVAASAVAADGADAERVVVTGSAIKRVQAEGAVPVETISQADIAATGATTVNELLRSIASFDIYDQGELVSGSPAGSGTATIRLRGFEETSVLVLLNGRRLPVNALYDVSGAGGAVDVNMIPLSAIERIEILKDGGSAIYGADALAGVVNFITKKNYRGVDAKLMYGTSSRRDGTEKQLSIAGGFGDMAVDGYNFLLSYDNFQRDPIYRKDREISRTADFRRYGAGDGRSSFSPYGNLLDENSLFSGETVRPCPGDLYTNRCRYDFNASVLTAYNGADRQAAMLLGTLKLGEMTGSLQFSHAEAKDSFDSHPVPEYFVTSSGQLYAGRFMQGGLRVTDRKSELDYLNLGIEGRLGELDWDVTGGYGRSKVTNRDRNYFNSDVWYPALESAAVDGTSMTNDQALVDSMRVNPVRVGESTVSFIDGKVTGALATLPGGPLSYALGMSFWRETLTDTPDVLSQQDLVVGAIQQSAVDASRNAQALFGELDLPLGMGFEAQAALRYDDYPTAAKTSPKLALSWKANGSLMFRGSYTESFKMPRLKQLYGAQDRGGITLDTADECAAIGLAEGCGRPASEVSGGEKTLRPEKGKTWNLGVVYDVGGLSGTLDWWQVHLDDVVESPTIVQALQEGKYALQPNGDLFVYTTLQNYATRESSGIDLDTRFRLHNVLGGVVTFRNSATYYLDVKRKSNTGGDWEYVLDTYLYPRFRDVFRVSFDAANWSATLAYKYVGGFRDTDAYPTASQPTDSSVRQVSAFEQIDLAASYSGFKGWVITGGIQNLLDREPPFSATNAMSNRYSQMGFAELYSSRGRFYYLTTEYKFK